VNGAVKRLRVLVALAGAVLSSSLIGITSAGHSETIGPCDCLAELERALFDHASASVVEVTAIVSRENEAGGINTGSGFFWDTSGHIVTNQHVVEGATTIRVWLSSGEQVAAELVGSTSAYDLAVLRAKELANTPSPIAIGTPSNLKIGQWVYAIGSPLGLDHSLTTGIISALNRKLPTTNGREIENIIQTNAAIYPGSSGGPLLDSAGRLIGVNTVAYSGGKAGGALGFAIPVDVVKAVTPKLINNGRIPIPGIGIVPADEALSTSLGVEGVIIARIRPNSPADRAQLRAMDPQSDVIGDVITAAGGLPVHSVVDLVHQLERAGVGRHITLKIKRDGHEVDVSVDIIDISREP
jgi:S1-C subfamily serine protease